MGSSPRAVWVSRPRARSDKEATRLNMLGCPGGEGRSGRGEGDGDGGGYKRPLDDLLARAMAGKGRNSACEEGEGRWLDTEFRHRIFRSCVWCQTRAKGDPVASALRSSHVVWPASAHSTVAEEESGPISLIQSNQLVSTAALTKTTKTDLCHCLCR